MYDEREKREEVGGREGMKGERRAVEKEEREYSNGKR